MADEAMDAVDGSDAGVTTPSSNVLAGAAGVTAPDNGQPEGPQAGEGAAPLTYAELAVPEGVDIDDASLGEARSLFAGMKLPPDQAQKLVDFYAGRVRQYGEAQADNWVKLNEKWVSDFKADKEIGGDRVNDTVAAATKVMDRYGTPGLREALIMTGAGNHPEIIRFVARVGKAISEDRFVVAGGTSAGSRSAAEILYPDQTRGG